MFIHVILDDEAEGIDSVPAGLVLIADTIAKPDRDGYTVLVDRTGRDFEGNARKGSYAGFKLTEPEYSQLVGIS